MKASESLLPLLLLEETLLAQFFKTEWRILDVERSNNVRVDSVVVGSKRKGPESPDCSVLLIEHLSRYNTDVVSYDTFFAIATDNKTAGNQYRGDGDGDGDGTT